MYILPFPEDKVEVTNVIDLAADLDKKDLVIFGTKYFVGTDKLDMIDFVDHDFVRWLKSNSRNRKARFFLSGGEILIEFLTFDFLIHHLAVRQMKPDQHERVKIYLRKALLRDRDFDQMLRLYTEPAV